MPKKRKKSTKSKGLGNMGSMPPGYSTIMGSGPVAIKGPKKSKGKGIISQIEKM